MNLTEPFLQGVGRWLSRNRAARGSLRCVFFVGLGILGLGIAYLSQGLEIPLWLYLGGGMGAGLLCLLCYGLGFLFLSVVSRVDTGSGDDVICEGCAPGVILCCWEVRGSARI